MCPKDPQKRAAVHHPGTSGTRSDPSPLRSLFELPRYSSFSQRERELIEGVAVIRSCRRGAVIVREKAPSDSVFILLRGLIRARRISRQGKELTLTSFEPGSLVGELGAITGCSRSADVVADQSSDLAEISRPSFHMLLDNAPSFSRLIIEGLARNLQATTERFSAATFLDIHGRLKAVLRALATSVELDGETSLLVRQLPSHQHLATLVGCTREAISRGLKQLEEYGVIDVDGDQVWLEVEESP